MGLAEDLVADAVKSRGGVGRGLAEDRGYLVGGDKVEGAAEVNVRRAAPS